VIIGRGLRGLRRGLGQDTGSGGFPIGPPEIDASGNPIPGFDPTGGAFGAWLDSLGASTTTTATDPLTAAANAFGNLSASQATQFLNTLNAGEAVVPSSMVMYAGIAAIAFVILIAVAKK
jgi:hypothetical protein